MYKKCSRYLLKTIWNIFCTQKNFVKYLGVFVDHKLTWEPHAKHVVEKLHIARRILSKLKHYASKSVLKNVYYGIAYPYIHYGITSWGNSAAKFVTQIQIQQNYIVKIVNCVTSLKTRLFPLYQELNLLKVKDVFELEVLKFVYKFKNKTLPEIFDNYYQSASEIHVYSTRFAIYYNLAAAWLLKKNLRPNDLLNLQDIKSGITHPWNSKPFAISNIPHLIKRLNNTCVKEAICELNCNATALNFCAILLILIWLLIQPI